MNSYIYTIYQAVEKLSHFSKFHVLWKPYFSLSISTTILNDKAIKTHKQKVKLLRVHYRRINNLSLVNPSSYLVRSLISIMELCCLFFCCLEAIKPCTRGGWKWLKHCKNIFRIFQVQISTEEDEQGWLDI